METKKKRVDLYQITDGYFGKKPLDRIKVAFMGPFANLLFAFIAFLMIWVSGGREKPFSEHPHLIGWVDPHSQLYELGVRPGDELTKLNHRAFNGFQDLLYASVLDDKDSEIQGYKITYLNDGQKEEFDYT